MATAIPAIGTGRACAPVAAKPAFAPAEEVELAAAVWLLAVTVNAGDPVPLPARTVRPLGGDVARPLAQARRQGGVQLRAEDMHPGLREVADAAGVVEVEVGQHDVGDVLDPVTERQDLGFGLVAGLVCLPSG